MKKITQNEAEKLFLMEKVKIDQQQWDLPIAGNAVKIPIESKDKKEKFLLDLATGYLNIKRFTVQNRTRETIILRRICFNAPHRNPDGSEVGVPHMHIFKEDFDDKWAYPLPENVFQNLNDRWQIVDDFMTYCNVTEKPNIMRGLF